MLSSVPTKRDGRRLFRTIARSRSLRHLFIGGGLAIAFVTVAMLAAMIAVDAGVADRVIEGWASRKLGRSVHVEGLRAELLTRRPHLTLRRLTIANPTWAGAGDLASLADVSARVRPWSILSGAMRVPALTIGRLDLHLIRDTAGRNNWTLGTASPGRPALDFLEGTDRLGIVDGHVDLRDLQHSFRFAGVFRHDPSVARALTLSGTGDLKGAEVVLAANGGSLNGRAVGRPYPFTARIADGGTIVDATGHSAAPFDLSTYSLSMLLRGPNLADLTYLFNLQTPNSRPYRLSVDASARGSSVLLNDLHGRVGGSDLRGVIQSDQSRPHHRVKADLVFGRWTKADIEAAFVEPPPRARARSASGALIRTTVSTTNIPISPPENPGRCLNHRNGGSLLDADHPASRVPFARRSTP